MNETSIKENSFCTQWHCCCITFFLLVFYGSTFFANQFSFSSLDYSDCAKPDPEVNGDTEKNFAELLSEELKLRENDALENQRRADMALLEAKKIASQYQKEADKCNSGMETCEQAREKAELALVAQKKVTALWELRARQKGWKEGVAKSNTQSQGKVQTS
ncbi:cellulose synthase-like protein h1-like [Trifolium pratense]|uniref:Cellulose synthase-like protein h1-like n=1 Tax=Trifolium pratense TaxID=57577 RepID=A0A2K3N4M6_TRIPR|nr:cellulose synthase-like protein h1-like [Trifolium pratense]